MGQPSVKCVRGYVKDEGELHHGALLRSEQMCVRNLSRLFWCSYSFQVTKTPKATPRLPLQCMHLLGGHTVVSCHPHCRVPTAAQYLLPLEPPVLADTRNADFCQLRYITPV